MSQVEQFSKVREVDEGPESSGSQQVRRAMVYTPARRTVRRLEFGFFVRKIVNGRVVKERTFPPWSRRHQATQAADRSPVTLEAAEAPEHVVEEDEPIQGEQRTMALRSGTVGGEPDTDGSGSTTEETTYEVGFFVRTESTVPPEYKDPPNG